MQTVGTVGGRVIKIFVLKGYYVL